MNALSVFFKALSDPSRLRMLTLLRDSGELCVCDIESVMGCTQTKVSRHLGYLRRAGVVRTRKQGLWVYYSLAPRAGSVERRIIDTLGSTLRSEPDARNDAARLASLRGTGCCAVKITPKPGKGRSNGR
jgi:ArsR family transcriptional regulator